MCNHLATFSGVYGHNWWKIRNFAPSWRKQLSTPDHGRCASTSESAKFNLHEAQRQPILWAASLCVYVRFAERRGSMVGSPLFMPSPLKSG